MSLLTALYVLLASAGVLFVTYGIRHEDEFVAFEDKVFRMIKRKIYLYRKKKAIEKRRQQGGSSSRAAAPARREQPVRSQAAPVRRQFVA